MNSSPRFKKVQASFSLLNCSLCECHNDPAVLCVLKNLERETFAEQLNAISYCGATKKLTITTLRDKTSISLRQALEGDNFHFNIGMSLDLACKVGSIVLKCLEEYDVAHMEIAPENIFIDRRLQPRLVNWMKCAVRDPVVMCLAADPYEPIEMIDDKWSTRNKITVWQLAVLLVEMIDRKVPFVSWIDVKMEDAAYFLENGTPRIRDLVSKGLGHREQRYSLKSYVRQLHFERDRFWAQDINKDK